MMRTAEQILDAMQVLIQELRDVLRAPPKDPPVVPPAPPVTDYTLSDLSPRKFPVSEWLTITSTAAPYLQGRCWWVLMEMAKEAGFVITVLNACSLSGDHPPTHPGCDKAYGGMTVDCKYPVLAGKLDDSKMKLMVNKFLSICVPPLPPDKAWRDVINESEIRIGSDVQSLIGYGGNRHIQVDDSMHHRYDDSIYPHFHVRFWWDKV